jgi:hypothetical protein
MADAAAEAAYTSLEDFLDTLPRKPCEPSPMNRYYCTVCERLNKGVAARCKNSKIEIDQKEIKEGEGGAIQFIKVPESEEGKAIPESDSSAEEKIDKVEFKVITPLGSDDDYPLIEFVQPKDKKVEPIEMDLLENVAIEFEVSGDEPVEVEALEVIPLDDAGEEEMVGTTADEEGVEVEVLEVEVLDEDISEDSEVMEPIPEFKPLPEQASTPAPRPALSPTLAPTSIPSQTPSPTTAPTPSHTKSPKPKLKRKHKMKLKTKRTAGKPVRKKISSQPTPTPQSQTQPQAIPMPQRQPTPQPAPQQYPQKQRIPTFQPISQMTVKPKLKPKKVVKKRKK